MTTAKETFQEIKENIESELKKSDLSGHFPQNKYELLCNLIQTVFQDIDNVMNDKFTKSEVDKDQIVALLNFIEKLTALSILSKDSHSLLEQILQCLYNWNLNVLKDSEITDKIHICNRLLLSKITMLETMNILKSLISHIDKNIINKIKKQSDGISGLYLDLIKSEENNE